MSASPKILTLAAGVFKVLAWVVIVLGVISYIVIFSTQNSQSTSAWIGAAAVITGVLYFFFFFVASEAIKVLLEIRAGINKV